MLKVQSLAFHQELSLCHSHRILTASIGKFHPINNSQSRILAKPSSYMCVWDSTRLYGHSREILKASAVYNYNPLKTSSFCFLSGVVAGSVCALQGGTWSLVIHMKYATEVCIYTFLTRYLTVRRKLILNLLYTFTSL
ncbi:hypothetical protein SASPL_112132 [Salvia splendens]|uniref:Uncharacterized protein n=1 Tax=Salvia splendens TaxID=180675 RepID=A0A8X8Y9F0_SALSN|nr:hypothetical protein SASPL_112132 [Salvia splendens]